MHALDDALSAFGGALKEADGVARRNVRPLGSGSRHRPLGSPTQLRWQTFRFGDFLGLGRGSGLVGIGIVVSHECRISERGIIVSGARGLHTSGGASFLGRRCSIFGADYGHALLLKWSACLPKKMEKKLELRNSSGIHTVGCGH